MSKSTFKRARTAPAAEPAPPANRWHETQEWISLAARVGLAVVMFWSGIAKAMDFPASILAVKGYQLFPDSIAELIGYGLPIVELMIGLLLLLGLLTRWAALAEGLIMLAFVIGISQAWARGLSIDCGCFGGGGEVADVNPWTYLWEILRDIGLMAVAAFLVIWPWSKFSADRALAIEPLRRPPREKRA